MTSFRHYSNLRFAIFTLYSTATAGLIYITLIINTDKISRIIEISSALFGLLITYIAIDMEDRLSAYLSDITRFIKKNLGDKSHITTLHDTESNDASQKFKNILLCLMAFWVVIALEKIITAIF